MIQNLKPALKRETLEPIQDNQKQKGLELFEEFNSLSVSLVFSTTYGVRIFQILPLKNPEVSEKLGQLAPDFEFQLA